MTFNKIPADLESWADAPFPVQIIRGMSKVVLLAAVGEPRQVVGYIYHGNTPEDSWTCQAVAWNADGGFGDCRGTHPSMDLPPPPAQTGAEVLRLREEVAEMQARLDAYPDAPDAWRKRDENAVQRLTRRIEALQPSLEQAA